MAVCYILINYTELLKITFYSATFEIPATEKKNVANIKLYPERIQLGVSPSPQKKKQLQHVTEVTYWGHLHNNSFVWEKTRR
jgi:hypothetical protein